MRLVLLALGLVACGSPASSPKDEEDARSDTGSWPDTALIDRLCTEAVTDLTHDAWVFAEGGLCTDCPAHTPLQFASRVNNPCSAPVVFTTPTSCLLSRWEVEPVGGKAEAHEPEGCEPGPTAWEVDHGAFQNDTWDHPGLPPGTFVLRVYTDTEPPIVAETPFVVVAP